MVDLLSPEGGVLVGADRAALCVSCPTLSSVMSSCRGAGKAAFKCSELTL